MLSNHERRELARIEAALREDPDWREPRVEAGPPRWWRRWRLQLLIGFAGLVMTIGILATDGPLLLQGVLLMGASCVWWLCRQVAAARSESQPPDQQPEV
jgi:Flp pilus assembly protein TadB